MSTRQHLDLSTANITPETLIKSKCHRYLVAEYEEGAFFWVPEPEDIDPETPEDLKLVLLYAARQNCGLVRFDADAELCTGLPKYEWLETLQV